MDFPLTSRTILGPSTALFGIETFGGCSDVELQTAAAQVWARFTSLVAPIAPVFGDPPTPCNFIRGFDLSAACDKHWVCTLQVEPHETALDPGPIDWTQEAPMEAMVGQFGSTGWSALRFFQADSVSEYNRILKDGTAFVLTQLARFPLVLVSEMRVHEVQLAGAGRGRALIAAALYSFEVGRQQALAGPMAEMRAGLLRDGLTSLAERLELGLSPQMRELYGRIANPDRKDPHFAQLSALKQTIAKAKREAATP